MAKKFTVSDFIKYCAPCFSCGKSVHIYIHCDSPVTYDGYGPKSHSWFTAPEVTSRNTKVYLKQCYSNEDTIMISIDHKTNRLKTSNLRVLDEYLQDRQLYLESVCQKCESIIYSEPLIFDLKKGIVNAFELHEESVIISDAKITYNLVNYFDSDTSYLHIRPHDKSIIPTSLDLPLMPRYNFKNKEHLMRKLQTIVTFQ